MVDDPFVVVGMNGVNPQFRSLLQSFVWKTPNFLESRTDIGQCPRPLAVGAFKHEKGGADIFRQLPETFSATPQGLVGALIPAGFFGSRKTLFEGGKDPREPI